MRSKERSDCLGMYIVSVTGLNVTYILTFPNTHCDPQDSQLWGFQLTWVKKEEQAKSMETFVNLVDIQKY